MEQVTGLSGGLVERSGCFMFTHFLRQHCLPKLEEGNLSVQLMLLTQPHRFTELPLGLRQDTPVRPVAADFSDLHRFGEPVGAAEPAAQFVTTIIYSDSRISSFMPCVRKP